MASRTGIALGTNVGNRLANLRKARDLLVNLMPAGTTYKQSGVYQSEPVDCPRLLQRGDRNRLHRQATRTLKSDPGH
jgi:7,8-dihydro-6-hydroxymethylpterin-pyrophosphokinase